MHNSFLRRQDNEGLVGEPAWKNRSNVQCDVSDRGSISSNRSWNLPCSFFAPRSSQPPPPPKKKRSEREKTDPVSLCTTQPLMQNESINKTTSSTTATSTTQSVQFFQPDSSTLNNTQSTLITPTYCPQPLPSISPIVSNLPKETASKLKICYKKVSSRKKYVRKCFEEIFSAEELASSNVSGNAGKDKLDQYKIGLINRKYRQLKILIIAW